jgi:hypothetical protein
MAMTVVEETEMLYNLPLVDEMDPSYVRIRDALRSVTHSTARMIATGLLTRCGLITVAGTPTDAMALIEFFERGLDPSPLKRVTVPGEYLSTKTDDNPVVVTTPLSHFSTTTIRDMYGMRSESEGVATGFVIDDINCSEPYSMAGSIRVTHTDILSLPPITTSDDRAGLFRWMIVAACDDQ